MMYSAEYEITLSNLVKLFTSVKYSIEFLMSDLLSRILHLIFTSCMNSIDFCHICAEYH